jgi:hypothetical protein
MELIIDREDNAGAESGRNGRYQFTILPGQTAADVLRNLGYS